MAIPQTTRSPARSLLRGTVCAACRTGGSPRIFHHMPIYTYHCADCGADFEKLVRNGTRVACPSCESRTLERRMSLPAPPASAGKAADFGSLGPPAGGGGCCGGSCHSHRH